MIERIDRSPNRMLVAAVLVWSGVAAALFIWHYNEHKAQIIAACRVQAVRSYEKDILFRRWAAMHGGVYVPVSDKTPPNSYLKHLPEQNITTPSGKRLTLMNPAYMIRQIFELEKDSSGDIVSRITGLNPRNPSNAPDAWEAAAFARIAAGASDVEEVLRRDGKEVFRFIRPLRAEESCLTRCHNRTYRPGDVLGGISVAVPLAPIVAAYKSIHLVNAVTYVAIWLFGSAFILIAMRKSTAATKALMSSEEMFSKSFKNAPVLMTLSTVEEGTFIAVNDRFTEVSGFLREEAVGSTAVGLGWNSREGCDRIQGLLRSQNSFSGLELTMRARDGRTVFCSCSGEIVDIAGEKRILLIAEDVTESRKAQAEFHRHREQLQFLIDEMPDACIFWDSAFKVVFWNPAAERIFGYSFSEAMGKHAFDLIISAPMRDQVQEVWSRLVSGGAAARTEIKNITRQGKTITCEWHNAPVRDEAGAIIGVISMAQDVSERRLLEEQLRQAQKFEAIGTLAAGIAHDFNNILTAISGYGHLLLMNMPSGNPMAEDARQIIHATARASQLTQGLLTFSRKQQMSMQVFDLNEAVRSFDQFIRRILAESIELRTTVCEQRLPVLVDRSQLEQVFMNLVTNARDAMPEGGALSIAAGIAEIDGDFIQRKGYGAEGTYALLTVRDTGLGMDVTTKQRIFDPFFTTKEVGKGTGLGLAVVYGIVKQHGGFIDIESAPGAGTTCLIYLPLHQGAWKTPSALDGPHSSLSGNETILLAEDDEMVRDLTRKLLERFGYRVIEASDGEEALRLYRENRERIALVLTDVMMPKMNGRRLYEVLRSIDRGVKVIFMSGYADDLLILQELQEAGLSFLQKPVSPATLLSLLRRELEPKAEP